MMISFKNWLMRRNENFGGSAGDPSGAGLDEPENGERQVTIEPSQPLDGNDKPPTAKNRKAKIVGKIGSKIFSKKGCNCK